MVIGCVSLLTGCGVSVVSSQDHLSVDDEARLLAEGDEPAPVSSSSPKERPRRGERSSPQGAAGVPGLSFRFGLQTMRQSESISTALSLAMRTLMLRRMAFEIGVDTSFSTGGQERRAVLGGSLSWIWFLGDSSVFRPYFVLGNGVSADTGAQDDGVLINFIGGIGFELMIARAFGVGLDCRAFAALASGAPDRPRHGLICTAAFAYYPLSSLF